MEAMRSRDSAEFISEFGSSVPLVHASMSFIDCSPCPGNITDWLIDIQSWQSALRRLSTCRRRRGNGAATLSRYSTPLALLCMLRIFLRKGIRGSFVERFLWLLLHLVSEVVVFKGTYWKNLVFLMDTRVDWYAFDYKSIRSYWMYIL